MSNYLSIRTIAKKYDVSKHTVRGWLKRYKDLRVIKIGGCVRIREDSLNKHIEDKNSVYQNAKIPDTK